MHGFWTTVLFIYILSIVICYYLGKSGGWARLGLVIGIFLGPLGVLILAMLKYTGILTKDDIDIDGRKINPRR